MKKILVTMAALFACQTGHAGSWYVGAGLGAAHANDASTNAALNNSTLSRYGISEITSYEDRSAAVSLLGGYRFNKHVAAEFNYNYLGYYDMYGVAAAGAVSPSGEESNWAYALSLDAVLTAPIYHSFSLYGKFGPTLTTNEESTCTSNNWWCDYTSDTKNGLMYGAGVTFSFPRLIGAFRLEADRFTSVGDSHNEFTAGKFTLIQLQYVYSFPERN